jgi:hypothetical protein
MTTPFTEAVIAGSKGFALALLAPLTERVGTRPRIASDPAQAIALCGGRGLVVVEFQGEGSLRAIQELALHGAGLRIVAAVPAVHAAAEGALRALGVDLARWDGRPDDVLGAVARQLTAAPARLVVPAAAKPAAPPRPAAASPAAAPAPAVARAAVAPYAPPARAAAAVSLSAPLATAPRPARAPQPPPGGGLFEDLREDDFHVEVADGGAPVAAPSVAPSTAAWPANVPGPREAAGALARGLAGVFDPPGTPLAAIADVVNGLSELERAVLAGEPQPVDGAPIRRAAVMRVRVAVALAPPAGTPVDEGAVSALLADIDALLSEVNAVTLGAPPELQPSLEAIRNALVKEAIDLSEVAQRLAGPVEAAAQPARRAPRAPQARVLSISGAENADRPRNTKLFVALAIAAIGAAAFHGNAWLRRRNAPLERPPSIAGAPSGMIAPPTAERGPQVLVPGIGPTNPDEVERFKLQQKLKGNEVQEVEGGALLVFPPGSRPESAPRPAR